MPISTNQAIVFYSVLQNSSDTDYVNLESFTYQPIKNQRFKWSAPLVTVDSAQLNKKPKMDIAVAVATDVLTPANAEVSTSAVPLASNEETTGTSEVVNPVDNQHLLTDNSPTTAENLTVEGAPSNASTSSQMPNQTSNNDNDQKNVHAASNNPISFKTIKQPNASHNLSSIPPETLVDEGLIGQSSADEGLAVEGETPLQLPDYEAIPETLTNDASVISPDQATNKIDAAQLNDGFDSSGEDQLKTEQNLDSNHESEFDSDPHEDLDPDELTRLEEEQLKEKEAKLEAYKQFVAEQESQVEIDYQGIRVSIEANALPSRMYFTMNALSAIIASYGLVVNSAAVVIGAMLVAMMLGPISGVALALIDYRIPLLRKSLLTVIAGGSMVVLIGFIVGWIHQDLPLSSEILSRTQPTSMDLMIALAGGTAGAYAMISPNLSVAVVGVAVATALVPPLAASGILFSHGEGSLGFGALLLAITNIIAIQFTNALVLWFSGFRRLMVEDYKTHPFIAFCRRNAVPLVLLVGIGGYLSYNLNIISKKQKFETEVNETISDYFIDKGNSLTVTQFVNNKDYQMIRAVIRGETRPSSIDAKHLENVIAERRSKDYPSYLPVRVQLRYMPVVVIDSSPDFNGSINKTDAAILNSEGIN